MNAMYIHRIWDRVKDLETPWNRRTLQASSLDREWGAWWQGSAYSQLDQWRGTSHMGNSIASNCTSKEEDPTSVRVRTYIRICFHAKRCIYKAQWWLLCVAVWLHFLAEVGRLSTTGTRIFFFLFPSSWYIRGVYGFLVNRTETYEFVPNDGLDPDFWLMKRGFSARYLLSWLAETSGRQWESQRLHFIFILILNLPI